MITKKTSAWLMAVLWWGILAAVVSFPQGFAVVLRWLFPELPQVLPEQYNLLGLLGQHMGLVMAASGLTVALALPLGVFVSLPAGRELLPLVQQGAALAQTFPPAAVLALSYPLLGFGFWPTLLALMLYGLLPVVAGVVAGLESVPEHSKDAALGLGMTTWQRFWQVEWPLALHSIVGGIRSSVVSTIGTATIGAAIGAGGLGLLIFAGLETQNNAYVLAGAIPTALLALACDATLAIMVAYVGVEQ
jgi:osmoprotectant transport system permease protein